MYIIIVVLFIVGSMLIWFRIPYSPLKTEFQNDISSLITNTSATTSDEIFQSEEFAHLPMVIRKYIESCGYIGKPKMKYMKMEYQDVDFMQSKSGPTLKIDYTQYNFILEPARMAFIDSSMFGIPFEGYDSYQNGIGGMKGVIAKGITLFDQKGDMMDKACLATFLAESMFAPTILLQDYISFEEISDYEVKASFTYKNQTAGGIFTFNDKYEMVSFVTNDRAVTNSDGTMEYIPWTALCGEYQVAENEIKSPTKFQAVWNYEDGDFVYFDGVIKHITYD